MKTCFVVAIRSRVFGDAVMRMLILLILCNAVAGSVFAQNPKVSAKSETEATMLAFQLEINGVISPAVTDYIERSMDKAVDSGAELILIRMDTPGGLDLAMRTIIKKIIASPVPVVCYVAPSGARAASAGTYILYASHIAAMAPATNLGAATPVQLGSPGGLGGDEPDTKDEPADDKEKKPDLGSDAMTSKMVNDAVAYIRGLANMRGRNADWAEKAVREAASFPAEEALKNNVIDIVAVDQADLFRQLDGQKVNVLGHEKTLSTTGLILEKLEPDWRSELLAVITNPNVAYILMLIGIYGLIFEFSNPGAVLPGTIGAICLLLALFAFQVLPINYAGLGLILLGIGLMVAEAFAPSFGILGLGGVVAFVIGSVILMDTDLPGFGINLGLVGAFALASALLFVLALGMVLKSWRKPVVCGKEELIGAVGFAVETFDKQGLIRIHSENWRARTDTPLEKGEKALVKAIDGLNLMVTAEKKQETPR